MPCLPSSTPHHQLLPGRYPYLLPARPGGRSLGPHLAEALRAVPAQVSPPAGDPLSRPRPLLPMLSQPSESALGPAGERKGPAAEPAGSSGDTALQGSRVPHATRTNTDQSLLETFSVTGPAAAAIFPPPDSRRYERRRGQAALRASSARPAASPWPRPKPPHCRDPKPALSERKWLHLTHKRLPS